MIDLSKIKPGDEVTVRFTVHDINEWDVFLARSPDKAVLTGAPVSHIVSHTPKALAVGDRVKMNLGGNEWRIEAIKGRWAWIFGDDSDSGELVMVDGLERVS